MASRRQRRPVSRSRPGRNRARPSESGKVGRPSVRAYSDYVQHSRFGRAPRFTGFDPDPDADDVHLHWNTGVVTGAVLETARQLIGERVPHPHEGETLVPGTAIAADLSKQRPATVPVTHYYDIDKACRDCGLRFIFFAEEQKYWYEELGFPLDSDAVRCQVCRRRTQEISRLRKRYQELSQVAARTTHEELEMANCCLNLIEDRVFPVRQLAHVRELLNRVPEAWRSSSEFKRASSRAVDLSNRLEE